MLIRIVDRLSQSTEDALFAYDVSTWQVAWKLEVTNLHIYNLTFSPDSKFIALGGDDRTVRHAPKRKIFLVDVAQRKISGEMEFQGPGVVDSKSRLPWSPDGSHISSAGGEGIQIFSVQTGQQVFGVSPPWSSARAALRYTPDGRYLIEGTGNDKKTGWGKIWDAEHQHLMQDLGQNVSSIAVSRDSRYMATGVYGKTLIWEFRQSDQH